MILSPRRLYKTQEVAQGPGAELSLSEEDDLALTSQGGLRIQWRSPSRVWPPYLHTVNAQ